MTECCLGHIASIASTARHEATLLILQLIQLEKMSRQMAHIHTTCKSSTRGDMDHTSDIPEGGGADRGGATDNLTSARNSTMVASLSPPVDMASDRVSPPALIGLLEGDVPPKRQAFKQLQYTTVQHSV